MEVKIVCLLGSFQTSNLMSGKWTFYPVPESLDYLPRLNLSGTG